MKKEIKIALVLFLSMLSNPLSCKSLIKQSDDIMAEQYNYKNVNGFQTSKDALAYGVASTQNYQLAHGGSGYTKVTYVDTLPERFEAPKAGPAENVDEIPTISDYYDGSAKLNTIQVKCKIFTTALDCLRQSSCGWCGSSNSCVLGNNMGPLQACMRSSYIFSPPIPNWNRMTTTNEANVAGIKLSVINK